MRFYLILNFFTKTLILARTKLCYTPVEKILAEMKKELIPLLKNESEMLIARLESKRALEGTQIKELVQDDPAKRIDKLLHMFAIKNATKYQSFIDVLEENGDRQAAKMLKDNGNKIFPQEYTEEASRNGQQLQGK